MLHPLPVIPQLPAGPPQEEPGESRRPMDKAFYVYLLASQQNGTLYVGVTSDLIRRVWEHRSKLVEGFTKRYNVTRLVYYEHCPNAESAIKREKRLKNWQRRWKLALIEESNPDWEDLYEGLVSGSCGQAAG